MAKAKFIACIRDKFNPDRKTFIYEYRGHEYMFDYCGFCDFHSFGYYHKREQEKIDRMIEDANKPKVEKQPRPEDDAQYGFDLFWKYVEGEIDESAFENA